MKLTTKQKANITTAKGIIHKMDGDVDMIKDLYLPLTKGLKPTPKKKMFPKGVIPKGDDPAVWEAFSIYTFGIDQNSMAWAWIFGDEWVVIADENAITSNLRNMAIDLDKEIGEGHVAMLELYLKERPKLGTRQLIQRMDLLLSLT